MSATYQKELGVVRGWTLTHQKSQVKAHIEELQLKGEVSGGHVKHHFLIRNRI